MSLVPLPLKTSNNSRRTGPKPLHVVSKTHISINRQVMWAQMLPKSFLHTLCRTILTYLSLTGHCPPLLYPAPWHHHHSEPCTTQDGEWAAIDPHPPDMKYSHASLTFNLQSKRIYSVIFENMSTFRSRSSAEDQHPEQRCFSTMDKSAFRGRCLVRKRCFQWVYSSLTMNTRNITFQKINY